MTTEESSHRLLVSDRARASFYTLVVRVYLDESWRDTPAHYHGDGPLFSAADGFGSFGLAALDLSLGPSVAQRWFAEAGGSYFGAMRLSKNAFARDVWRCLSRVGLCRDSPMAKRVAAAYLKTPEAIHGEEGEGGPSPVPNDHWWHPTRVLACFFAESSEFGASLDGLLRMPPPKGWKHSGDWWRGLTRLAKNCLGTDRPEPFGLLREQAEINQRMFEQWHKEDFYERWFGELTLAFACAAQHAGWTVPDDDPHPSLPLGCLRLAPRRVVVREPRSLPKLDDELRAPIERAYKKSTKRAGKKSKKRAKKKATPKSKR